MTRVGENLSAVKAIIRAACGESGRADDSVELIAVSKTYPTEAIAEAIEVGQFSFGESRVQEAIPKISSLPSRVKWHFIGRLQKNKVRKVLQNFDTIHAIDSLSLARYTNDLALELGSFPKVFIQVNIGDEESKGGFSIPGLRSEMETLLGLRRLEVQGLMCIPPAGPSPESSRKWFDSLRRLRDGLEGDFGVKLPGLSMGMSGDYSVAIEEGATHVRVGSAIFGTRTYRVDGELG